MFRGSASAKIDAKGRLKVPTDFRRTLEDAYGTEVFITSVTGESAKLYPLPVWEGIERKLAEVPSSDRAKQRFLERVNHFGQQLKLDAQGRVLIPQILREHAEILGEVVVSGRIDQLEIWNRESFDRRLKEEPFDDEDFKALAEYGI